MKERQASRLSVRGLSRTFAGRPAIVDVGFTVAGGEFVAVLGPSGAGKTTLFRCITGQLAPDRGTVRIDGADVTTLRGRQRRPVAVVFQRFGLVGRLSALQNVLAGRLGHAPAWRGMLRRFTRADRLLALACLDRVGLLAEAGQRADTLSGGQQQRVGLARALAQQPRLIVADEPVASLDPAAGRAALDLLAQIARTEDVAVVCSLHQVDLAQACADRIIGLAAGRLVADEPAGSFDQAGFHRLYRAAPTLRHAAAGGPGDSGAEPRYDAA